MAPETVADINPEALFANGLDDALIGYVEGWHPNGERFTLALYDRERCIELLIAEGMTYEEAEEHFEFNVSGAYAGPGTPTFATLGM
jgi:hypothetical protein